MITRRFPHFVAALGWSVLSVVENGNPPPALFVVTYWKKRSPAVLVGKTCFFTLPYGNPIKRQKGDFRYNNVAPEDPENHQKSDPR